MGPNRQLEEYDTGSGLPQNRGRRGIRRHVTRTPRARPAPPRRRSGAGRSARRRRRRRCRRPRSARVVARTNSTAGWSVCSPANTFGNTRSRPTRDSGCTMNTSSSPSARSACGTMRMPPPSDALFATETSIARCSRRAPSMTIVYGARPERGELAQQRERVPARTAGAGHPVGALVHDGVEARGDHAGEPRAQLAVPDRRPRRSRAARARARRRGRRRRPPGRRTGGRGPAARSLPVPAATMPSGTPVCATMFTPSETMPSPPTTTSAVDAALRERATRSRGAAARSWPRGASTRRAPRR